MKKVQAYLSHAIRGAKRLNATEEDIWDNCEEALQIAAFLRKHIPELDLYVPAEHEEFVHIAFQKGFLEEEQILDIDCTIISKRGFLIVLIKNEIISNGMGIEIVHAEKNEIPTIRIHVGDDLKISLSNLERLKKIIAEMGERI